MASYTIFFPLWSLFLCLRELLTDVHLEVDGCACLLTPHMWVSLWAESWHHTSSNAEQNTFFFFFLNTFPFARPPEALSQAPLWYFWSLLMQSMAYFQFVIYILTKAMLNTGDQVLLLFWFSFYLCVSA